MALNDFTVTNAEAAPVFATPAASELIPRVNRHTAIWVKAGGTSFGLTIVIPGLGPGDLPLTDKITTVGVGVERLVKIPVEAVDDATGLATVNFSNQTTVTACLIRM